MSDSWDAVVVGAGLAGSATARLLAIGGARVALVDAATFPRQKVCGEFLAAPAWSVLDRLGLGALRRTANPLDRLCLAVSGERSITIGLPEAPSARPLVISRYALDEALVEHARRAGVAVFCGQRVRDVMIDEATVVGVTTTPTAGGGHELTFRTRRLIAADGRGSLVVRRTGSVVRGRSTGVGIKRHLRVDGQRDLPVDTISMCSLPGGYFGACAVGDEMINLCGVIPRRVVQAHRGRIFKALADYLRAYPEWQSLVASQTDEDGWHTIPDVAVQRARPQVAGVLYVGDASGTIEPLTGAGMSMALLAAEMVAEQLTADLKRISPALQLAYERQWNARFSGTIQRATWFGRVMRRPLIIHAALAATAHRVAWASGLANWGRRMVALPTES